MKTPRGEEASSLAGGVDGRAPRPSRARRRLCRRAEPPAEQIHTFCFKTDAFVPFLFYSSLLI